ncbi:MAG: pitrilysin family protein, partial [Rhodothermales bacterium]|nr:pitrilysin family protein [Rhodothermales bacterium]
SRNERPGLTGATHFLEHLMFKGSRNFNRENGRTVFTTLQTLGARVNATTWFDRTNYYELLPREHLSLAAEIEADRMRGALLLPEDVESERTVILNELDRGENEPIRKLYHSVWSTAFEEHPYHHPTIGWREDVENTSPDGLRGFYDTYYWPNNATVSVIGDVEAMDALDTISEHFGGIASSNSPIPDIDVIEPPQEEERRVVVERVGQLGAVMIAFKQPPAQHPDADRLAMLAVVLAGGKASRLHRRLTDRGLTAGVYSSPSGLRDPGLFYVLAPLAPDVKHEQVEKEILEELESIQADGISEAVIVRAKNQVRSAEAYSRDGSYAIASELNEAIAAGDWQLYTKAVERAERVTAKDVQLVAQQYCVEPVRTIGYYRPTGPMEGKPSEEL